MVQFMKEIILQKLREIEHEHEVKILYACESGSRAWGFASPDSDYDVRFIYMHERNKYISIEGMKDVIELPVNELLDIGGWDLKKTLWLFRKSNAALYEWLQSPIVYLKDAEFLKGILELAPFYFSPLAGFHHYSSMAYSCYENELRLDKVKLKKYFYALRPVLAAKWIIDKNEIPPMEFQKLLRLVEDDVLKSAVVELMGLKSQSDEKFMIEPVEIVEAFIQKQLIYCDSHKHLLAEKKVDLERLNVFFRQLIKAN
jgi:predicted nucleotidyltransferase